jgi:hypothetical protein
MAAALPLNFTSFSEAVEEKLLPLMVTVVLKGPLAGAMPDTVGAGPGPGGGFTPPPPSPPLLQANKVQVMMGMIKEEGFMKNGIVVVKRLPCKVPEAAGREALK